MSKTQNLKNAIKEAVIVDQFLGCEFHCGDPKPGCDTCFLADFASNRIQKSIEFMRRKGSKTKRDVLAKHSFYRIYVK